MAELGITIAENLIEVTASAVIKEICDMWGYKSQLEDLNKTVLTIKNVLLDADSKRELSHATQGYIEDLKAVVYDADDLFDEFFTRADELKRLDGNKDDKFFKKVRRFFSGKKKEVSQAHRMSRQVKDIKEQLDTIVSNHHKFGLSVDYKPICRRREETCSYVNAHKIIGREKDKQTVIDMLLGPNDVHESFRFVTIVGVGGLGKTALAQLVCGDERVQAEFMDSKLRLWVCVSDQDGVSFDVKVILCKILELVSGKRPDDTSSMELVQKQFQEQLRGKKYLLVLDDVWSEDCEEWRKLCEYLMVGQGGSRIVVTTRSERIAEIIGKKHMYMLQGLSEENSWLLFESVAFDKGEQDYLNHPDLVDIGKKIVEKCYNVPLPIKVVGSLLFGQPMTKWQIFEQSGFAGIGNGDNKIMSILKLSYHNLSPSLKNCFSYCALFPKDLPLKRKDLINFWMAQGYIVSLDRDQSIEDAAEEHFLILVRRCFFQDVEKDKYGDIEYVKMHDLMHDVAQEVGKEEIGVVSSNTTKLGDKVRHVYFARGAFSQSYSFKSKIRSLISSDDLVNGDLVLGDPVDAQIDSWIGLRVLRLQPIGIKRFDSIGKLLHLRHLDLSRNFELEALPDSITRLHNLQTLELHFCFELGGMPSGMDKLTNLRHFDLSECLKLTSMPSGMDKLTNLRHFDLSGCSMLTSMPSGMDKLTNLRHFDLSECSNLTSMPSGMDKLTNLRYFDLSGCSKLTSMPSGMDKLTNLRHFDLSRCLKLTSMPSGMDKLTNLRHFDLKGCSNLTSMPSGMDKLTNLRHFDLSGCLKLTSMPSGMDKLTNLRHFDLKGCSKLTSMPSGMDKLTNLRHFDLSGCSKLTSMPPGMGKLTNLRVLPFFVVGMEKRVSTEEQCMGELKDLKPLTNLKGGIKIKIGKFYKNDGGEEYLKGLKYLTQVEIRFGYNFDIEWEDVMEKLEPPSNIKIFSLWGYKGTTIPRWGRALDNWALSLPHLVEIRLTECFKLEQIPSLSKLCNLKSLTLESLRKLEYMENTSSNNANEGEDFTPFFPSLESLYIDGLGSLKGWWREEELVEDDDDDRILRSSFTFPRLSKLVICKCPKLTSFPSCRNLEDLDLDKVDCFGNSQGDVTLRELLIDDVGLLNLINSPVNTLRIECNYTVESLSEYGDVFRKYKYTSSLRRLEISYCSNLRRLGRGGLEHLTALEDLKLYTNYQLSFSEDEVNDDGMPWKSLHHCLRSLTIRYCEAIKSLPESMRNLTSLQSLKIVGCPELEERCKEPDGEDWPKIQHIPHKFCI